ncbi:unnamed protein product, partial [Rotaria sordida]
MPINLRVEQQALGRTSRQGNRGTSQMILNIENVIFHLSTVYPEYIDEHPNLSTDDLHKIEYLRDWCQKAEADQLYKIRTKDIPEIKSKDQLFQRFCQLLSNLRKIDDDEYKLESVKERWGLWLKDRDRRDKIKFSLERNQLQRHITDRKLKEQMIKHIIQNKTCYKDFLTNIDNDTNILYIEETMMKALIRTININIVVFTSYDQLPIVYKRQNATQTILLAGEFDLAYCSLDINNSENILKYVSEYQDEDDTQVELITMRNHNDKQLYLKLIDAFNQQDNCIDYSKFEQQIRDQYQKYDKIIQNPFYHIAKADMLITKSHQFFIRTKQFVRQIVSVGTKQSIERENILQCLNAAIQLDSIYSFTAYVSRAYLLIEQKSDKYKENAIADLLKARDQINNFILPAYHSMQLNLYDDNNNHSDCDELSKQITIKTNIIELYDNHIQNAILIIENSQKLVDITIFNGKHISTIIKVERHKALQLIDTDDKNVFKFSVNDYFNRHRFKLSFHNLLVHKDMGIKQDQGTKLLKLMTDNYQDISIEFQPKIT